MYNTFDRKTNITEKEVAVDDPIRRDLLKSFFKTNVKIANCYKYYKRVIKIEIERDLLNKLIFALKGQN